MPRQPQGHQLVPVQLPVIDVLRRAYYLEWNDFGGSGTSLWMELTLRVR